MKPVVHVYVLICACVKLDWVFFLQSSCKYEHNVAPVVKDQYIEE